MEKSLQILARKRIVEGFVPAIDGNLSDGDQHDENENAGPERNQRVAHRRDHKGSHHHRNLGKRSVPSRDGEPPISLAELLRRRSETLRTGFCGGALSWAHSASSCPCLVQTSCPASLPIRPLNIADMFATC